MTKKREPSYEELERRLREAESKIQALERDRDHTGTREGPSLIERLADVEAAHTQAVRELEASDSEAARC